VETRRQKHLVLILAREFASNLATPTLIAEVQGKLVFYNEAAESVVDRPFAEVGGMPLDEWTARFEPRTPDSELLSQERGRPAACGTCKGPQLRARRKGSLCMVAIDTVLR
jgi:PAS domain-containing protein